MKILSKVVALFYASLIILYLSNGLNITIFQLVLVALSCVTALALLNFWGKFARVIGYVTSGLLCLASVSLFNHFSNQSMPLIEVILNLLFVVTGVMTVFCLNSMSKKKITDQV